MPNFFHNLADKAQSAINASPLAGKIPVPHSATAPRPASPDPAPQPAANQAAAQGGGRSHALDALSYQFRAFQQQYSSSTSPVQKIITAEKGLALDFDNVARESKTQSKELYTWGQTESEDLKDVTDRLAYLNFVHGSLAFTLSQKLDAARAPFKALRDAETALQPRRNIRAGIERELSRIENDPKRAGDLKDQLRKVELEDADHEREVEILKRKAVRDSEQLKWAAIQEYSEKLLLLSQAARPILTELPSVPPGTTTPYNGHQSTGAVRAALQQALDNHQPGTTSFKLPSAGADLSRSDTRSFGESHAEELSSIAAYTPPIPHPNTQAAGGTPPAQQPAPQPAVTHVPVPTFPAPQQPAPQEHVPVAHAPAQQSPPINPTTLNQTPAPLPEAAVPPVIATSSPESTAPATAPIVVPTVAETGLPLFAGTSGPGPATGSLHDLKHASAQSGVLQNAPHVSVQEEKKPAVQSVSPPTPAPAPKPAPAPQHPTAEEEKRRLAAAYSQAHPAAAPAPAPSTSQTHESAEEEKKRLEREERERILGGQSSTHHGPGSKDGEPDEDLPPYQEPGLQ